VGIGDAQVFSGLDELLVNGVKVDSPGPNTGFIMYAQEHSEFCPLNGGVFPLKTTGNTWTVRTITEPIDEDCLCWFLLICSGHDVPPSSTCEKLQNCACTSLKEPIDASQTLIWVTGVDNFITGETITFRVRIEDELLLVTSSKVNGSNIDWTVERGVEGTTATSHAAGVEVRYTLTKEGWNNFFSWGSSEGVATELCAQTGIFLGTTPGWYWWYWWFLFEFYLTWAWWFEYFSFFETSGSFSTVGSGFTTFDTSFGGSFLELAGTDSVVMRTEAYTATTPTAPPFKLSMGYRWWYVTTSAASSAASSGMMFRESSTGKFIFFRLIQSPGSSFAKTDLMLAVDKFTDPSTFDSTYICVPGSAAIGHDLWLRGEDDGTDLTFSYSPDSKHYHDLLTIGRTDFLAGGPDEIGYGLANDTTDSEANAIVFTLDKRTP